MSVGYGTVASGAVAALIVALGSAGEVCAQAAPHSGKVTVEAHAPPDRFSGDRFAGDPPAPPPAVPTFAPVVALNEPETSGVPAAADAPATTTIATPVEVAPQTAPAAPVETTPAPAAAPTADPQPAAAPAAPVQAAAAPAPAPADPVVTAIVERLRKPIAGVDKAETAALVAFYAKRTTPLFVSAGQFSDAGRAVVAELGRADDWGLVAKTYAVAAPAAATPEAMADAEIALAASALRYARHASGGRVEPSSLSRFNDLKPVYADPDDVLAGLSGAKPHEYLVSLHPKHPQFVKLRAALIEARSGGAPKPAEPVKPEASIPAAGPTLKAGSKHPDVIAIRARLQVDGEAASDLYDEDVADAVKAFQSEHGIKATGVLNAATRTALAGGEGAKRKAADPAKAIERIVLNMERWRWMPRDLGRVHVVNNVPEFVTRMYKDGEIIFKERIVVGKTNTPTPVFSANMQFVVFHPEWGVPDSIKVKEIWPSLRRKSPDDLFGTTSDTRVLQRHNMRVAYNGRVVDPSKIDWSTADPRQYSFIQAAGAGNVLGVVKFRFPNRHDVYMHDTQERSLFQHTTRAYSHGCMRVNNPRRFAEVILAEAEQPAWSAEKVGAALASKGTQEIKLDKPFPVHVVYLTARVDEATGKLETFGDLYGHDSRLASALAGKPVSVEPQETKEELNAEVRKQQKPKGQKQESDGLTQFFTGLFAN